MNIEIWSDFACPFCYIGKRRFEAALEQFPNRDGVTVIYRSFELDPSAARDVNQNVHEMLAAKYNMSPEKAREMNQGLVTQAESVGLTFHFDSLILTNTFDAHRLSHFAAKHGLMKEMTERLLKAYFTDSKHVGDHDVLTALAVEVGLDEAAVAQVLTGDEFTAEVRSDEQEANTLGIRGVPFFVINRKYAISGAQASEVFLEAMQKAWAEDHPLTLLNEPNNTEDGAACVDGVCAPAPSKP
ncbi:DsbA family oxidoreductase [Paenibacillus agricola]|uniref:DsbA family oxidoreductase n=1 Tax=Paenibacillus agricola TaxID=2716264 RepID=A0ABX0JD39_9BACL|nr:DsbA family oxidoreductase [Paenibacillus agricola]NHN32139.1 DsbA family oxidoreductase [Paenibacillus agricola]